jgi:hypothetical protein
MGRVRVDSVTQRSSSALRWLWWVPLACLLGIELYIRNFDGWGAWASAPLLLLPALLSLPIAILGLFDCVAAMRARAPIRAVLICTFFSALPVLWLGVRRFYM